MKYIYLILIAFTAAIIQISFLSNLRIYGAAINLQFLLLSLSFYITYSIRNERQTLLVAFILGIFVDLLSGGIFLSTTLSLIILGLLLELLSRLVDIDGQNVLLIIPIFVGSIIFDLIYLLLNRIPFLNWQIILPMFFNGVFSVIAFLVVVFAYRYFHQRRHLPEIKLS